MITRPKYRITGANGKDLSDIDLSRQMTVRRKADTKCWGCEEVIPVGEMYFWLDDDWHICMTCSEFELDTPPSGE